MRVLIVEKGSTTELCAPDSLAGLVWVLHDRWDHLESAQISIVIDRASAPYEKFAAANLNSLNALGEENAKPPGQSKFRTRPRA